MFFFTISVLNVLSLFFLWFKDYHLVYGNPELVGRSNYSNIIDIRLILCICLVFFLYKAYIFNKYKRNYTILSLHKLYLSPTYSIWDKILNFSVVLLNTTIFIGLGFIWFKVLYIELGYDLIGRIRLFSLFTADLNIYRVWSLDEKYNFAVNLVLDRYNCTVNTALEKLNSLSYNINKENILSQILSLDSKAQIKNNLIELFKYIDYCNLTKSSSTYNWLSYLSYLYIPFAFSLSYLLFYFHYEEVSNLTSFTVANYLSYEYWDYIYNTLYIDYLKIQNKLSTSLYVDKNSSSTFFKKKVNSLENTDKEKILSVDLNRKLENKISKEKISVVGTDNKEEVLTKKRNIANKIKNNQHFKEFISKEKKWGLYNSIKYYLKSFFN